MKQTTIDTSLTVDQRKAFMEFCADKYETDGTSPISDPEYDKEFYALQAIDPDWDIIGGMDEDHIYGTKVKHKVTCGSLLKDPSPEDFYKSLLSTYAGIDLSKHCFSLGYKLDGLAICCVYDDGKLQYVITRGRDGIYGVDVTPNGRMIEGIPETIPYKGSVEFRGEGYKNRKDFYKNWAGEYANPRNFASGSVNQKDPKTTKERKLEFIAYEVVRKDFDTEKEKQQFIVDNGFEHLEKSTKFTKVGLTPKQVAKAVKVFMDKITRSDLPFDIDGIVVKLNDIKVAKSLGSVSGGRKPKSNRAVKFPCEQKETEILGREYDVGRTGAITIVGLLAPVKLSGTTVKRVSLHNFAFIRKNDLTIGAKVLIQKSGDIIPYVVRKTEDGNRDFDIPDECPACGGDVEWDDNKITVHCQNDVCIAKVNRSIEHWFKKIGVLGFGKGTIGRLTDEDNMSWDDNPIIRSISDMYWRLDNDRHTEHPFQKYEYLKGELGEKRYENVLESVNSVKEITLAKFIEALGIANIGSMAKEIVAIAPTIDDVNALTANDLLALDGFGPKRSSGFVNGWKRNQDEIKRLLRNIEIVEEDLDSDKLDGMSFCFTGSFSDPTRKEMEKMVEDNGGNKSSVSSKLTALVWDEAITGGKYDKAIKLGLKIMKQEEFMALLD